MTSPATATITRLRECDCPPWVLRCVHFGEDVLVLASRDGHHIDAASRKHQERCDPREWFPFAVSAVSGGWEPCGGGCGYLYPRERAKGIKHLKQRYATEADALTAFYAAEEQLLRGEA